MINLLDDPEWASPPTAIEAAHYDRLLLLSQNSKAQRAEEAAARSRQIFGECLLALKRLGLPEGKARTMLGKWRKASPDDETLIHAVRSADRIGTPDPIGYITAALKQNDKRSDATTARLSSEWTLLGWEAPKRLADGTLARKPWKADQRGQAWRDPFGKFTILPAPEDIDIPSVDTEPGIEEPST